MVNPLKWDDPFDNFLFKLTKVDLGNGQEAPLSHVGKMFFGQCWTVNPESDAIWRIYSPCRDGIMVRSTHGKVLRNFREYLRSDRKVLLPGKGDLENLTDDEASDLIESKSKLYEVVYKSYHDIAALVDNGVSLQSFIGNYGMLKLLGIKRDGFRHEEEVRLVYCSGDSDKNDDVFPFAIRPDTVFDEVILDPRTTVGEEELLKCCLEKRGFNNPIRRSTLYDSPKFVMPLGAG